jgi:hypothetical protein
VLQGKLQIIVEKQQVKEKIQHKQLIFSYDMTLYLAATDFYKNVSS